MAPGAPGAAGLFAAPVHADAVPDSTEEEYDAAIQTLQAMFSLPRRVAARALAKARLRLPLAIELLLDKAQRDALVADSGLVVPPIAPQAAQSTPAAVEPRAALKTSEPRDLMSFNFNQPCVTRRPFSPTLTSQTPRCSATTGHRASRTHSVRLAQPVAAL